MNVSQIRDRLAVQPDLPIELMEGPGDAALLVAAEHWEKVCRIAHDDPELAFDFLRNLSGVDRPAKESIEIVAHLFSYRHRHPLVLKTRVPRAAPVLDSLQHIWPAANWYEREIFDLLGVGFNGHPDLRRILLPSDWVGHPLRKDYQEPAFYQGIPTSRPGYPKGGENA